MGNNRMMRNSFVYLLVIIGVIVIFYTLLPSFGGNTEQPVTTVIAMAKSRLRVAAKIIGNIVEKTTTIRSANEALRRDIIERERVKRDSRICSSSCMTPY